MPLASMSRLVRVSLSEERTRDSIRFFVSSLETNSQTGTVLAFFITYDVGAEGCKEGDTV